MELTGDLSDFALTDILQILSLSRKTGTLSLENGRLAGRIVIESGRITQATYRPGGSFGEYLVRSGRLSVETLANLKRLVGRDKGYWNLSGLLVESGMMSPGEVDGLARGYLQSVVSRLLALEKGRFGIDLAEPEAPEGLDEVNLLGGLEIGEVLLGAAAQRDETGRLGPSQQGSDNDNMFRARNESRLNVGEESGAAVEMFESRYDAVSGLRGAGSWDERDDRVVAAIDRGGERSYAGGAGDGVGGRVARQSSALCSLLMEMREKSFEAEVSLLIMRFASEIAARGVLFVVTESGLRGLGQYGLKGGAGLSADELIRGVVLRREDLHEVIREVIDRQSPYLGTRDVAGSLGELDRVVPLADGSGVQYFLLPVVAGGRTQFIVYGDNCAGGAERIGEREMEELLALTQQAGLVLEKIALERMLQELAASGVQR